MPSINESVSHHDRRMCLVGLGVISIGPVPEVVFVFVLQIRSIDTKSPSLLEAVVPMGYDW